MPRREAPTKERLLDLCRLVREHRDDLAAQKPEVSDIAAAMTSLDRESVAQLDFYLYGAVAERARLAADRDLQGVELTVTIERVMSEPPPVPPYEAPEWQQRAVAAETKLRNQRSGEIALAGGAIALAIVAVAKGLGWL